MAFAVRYDRNAIVEDGMKDNQRVPGSSPTDPCSRAKIPCSLKIIPCSVE
jgi:hypothetical protein